MRFATAAVALFAGVALAHGNHHADPEDPVSTAYETEYFTITSCAPDVEDCPGNVPAPTDVPPAAVDTSSALPVVVTPEPVIEPVQSYSAPVPTLTPVVSSSALPPAAAAESCGAVSIETVSTYITTVIPTVSYITHAAEPCETSPPAQPPVSSPPTNGTVPSSTPLPTGGAATLGASGLLAIVAGAVALFA
jgi:hypothetical protein